MDDISIDDRVAKVKRPRGRPPLNEAEKLSRALVVKETKWQPKKWLPEYEFIVALSGMGYSRGMIKAKLIELKGLDYTEQHITNILNCDMAKAATQMIVAHTRKAAFESIKSQLEDTAVKASGVINAVLGNDKVVENSPIAAGSLAIKFLQGVGKLSTQTNAANVNNNTQNNFVMGDTAVKSIVEALTQSNQIRELHADVSGDSIK